MFNLDILNSKQVSQKTKDEIAKLLKIDKRALQEFEEIYKQKALRNNLPDDFFQINAKQAVSMTEGITAESCPEIENITNRIVNELLQKTEVWSYNGKSVAILTNIGEKVSPVTNEEIGKIPENLRPQLTGSLMQIDINQSTYEAVLSNYIRYKNEKNPKKSKVFYDMFRQGLDILDMDDITYEIIGTNPNSMGKWLPQIVAAVQLQEFFKIPKTTIIKVPITMLQLTRLEYQSLTRTTLDIVDKFCKEVFSLNENEEYFIKTGTYSSKFDFRNAYVHGEKEVRELGEYLLFIHHQACQMASPLNNRSIYGVSTTNEWVVRKFIHDKEENPCIYKGLPLHTEYRVFVDFDTKQVIGINPYWDPKIMKQRFGHEPDANSPHNVHDYIIYQAHEEKLMQRYHDNKQLVVRNVEKLLQDVEGLTGQWSIDVMQNGEDFWIIDMALAINSAMVECVPKNLLKPVEENWLPKLE